ncbi:hypothetical protein CQA63_07460 [Helicobacter marmotae]|uniref:Uncharacterized protein n=2 Tax=Helicobacter marmotae TaxID=152490 RepID=A0A3D8I2G6_9HELI|nr:hypothetical protein CQA63_07460 [Helicobacter marmotae]
MAGGIYKGEGATSQFKPLPLIKKEKMESPEILQVCHSERSEESLKESLVVLFGVFESNSSQCLE